MNIYLYECKSGIKSALIWLFSLLMIVALFLSIFPTYASNKEIVLQVFAGFPPELLKAFTIDVEQMFSVTGFYTFTFLYISIGGAIQALNLSLSIFSKESRRGISDYLLTKPISRTNVLTAKLCASITLLLVTNIPYIFFTSMIATVVSNTPFNSTTFVLISLSLFFIQIIFFSIGMLLAILIGKIKSVITFSLGITFATFAINMISSAADDRKLKFLSPFSYFDYNYLYEHGFYKTSTLILASVFVLICIVLSYVIFNKKDIPSY